MKRKEHCDAIRLGRTKRSAVIEHTLGMSRKEHCDAITLGRTERSAAVEHALGLRRKKHFDAIRLEGQKDQPEMSAHKE